MPNHTLQNYTKTNNSKPNQAKSSQAKPSHSKPCHTIHVVWYGREAHQRVAQVTVSSSSLLHYRLKNTECLLQSIISSYFSKCSSSQKRGRWKRGNTKWSFVAFLDLVFRKLLSALLIKQPSKINKWLEKDLFLDRVTVTLFVCYVMIIYLVYPACGHHCMSVIQNLTTYNLGPTSSSVYINLWFPLSLPHLRHYDDDDQNWHGLIQSMRTTSVWQPKSRLPCLPTTISCCTLFFSKLRFNSSQRNTNSL